MKRKQKKGKEMRCCEPPLTQGRPPTDPLFSGVDTFLLTINTIMLFVFFLLEKNIVGGYYIIVDK